MLIARVTRGLLERLRERSVFTTLSGRDRWSPGERFGFEIDCEIEPYSQIHAGMIIPRTLGMFSYTRSEVPSDLRIGRYCSLAVNIAWMGENHPSRWASTSPTFYETGSAALRAYRAHSGVDYALETFQAPKGSIEIGSDVWIGDQAMIAPGVKIGHGAVIGARTVVLKDVPPFAVMVGAPARLARYRFSEDLIPRFLEVAWWRFSPDFVSRAPISDPQRFIEQLADDLAKTPRAAVSPTPLTGEEIRALSDPL
jgi:acetyltransferase-like isoleucine patch superfamily enzyme